MPRPDQTDERRRELLPIVALAFADLGYRRATTAELAKRCGVQENILYRLWPDKKAMFIAAIEHVYRRSVEIWTRVLANGDSTSSPAERMLTHEAGHYGESRLYRLVFAGMNETDDAEIRAALRRMYGRYVRFIREQIVDHRDRSKVRLRPDAELTAWAIVGIGSVVNIGQELGLMTAGRRKKLFEEIGRFLLEGA